MPVKFSTYELSMVTFTEPMLVMFDAEKVIPSTSTEQREKQIISKWRAFYSPASLGLLFLKEIHEIIWYEQGRLVWKYLNNNLTNSCVFRDGTFWCGRFLILRHVRKEKQGLVVKYFLCYLLENLGIQYSGNTRDAKYISAIWHTVTKRTFIRLNIYYRPWIRWKNCSSS